MQQNGPAAASEPRPKCDHAVALHAQVQAAQQPAVRRQNVPRQLPTLAGIQPAPPPKQAHCGTLAHDDMASVALVAEPNILRGGIIPQSNMSAIRLICCTYCSFVRNNHPICQPLQSVNFSIGSSACQD